MKTWLSIGAAVAAIAAAQPATAGCASFKTSIPELQLNYNPFNPGAIDRVFNLRVDRIDPEVTAVRVLFADNDGGVFAVLGTDGPTPYEIEWMRDQSQQVLVTGAEQPNPANGALIQFSPRGGANEPFRIRVPAGRDVGAGEYYQPFDIRYVCYRGDGTEIGPEIQTSAEVAATLNVPSRITTYVGSPGVRTGRLSFGTIEPGTGMPTRSLAITAQSTVPYDIDLKSERGGLRRGIGDRYVLAYRLWLSDLPVADGSRVSCPRTQAPSGRTHSLRAGISQAEAAAAPAGDYQDTVTLTFSPRLGLGGGQACEVSVN